MMMEKSWVMMMERTDKEHKEQEEATSTSEVQYVKKEQFVILRLESTDGWKELCAPTWTNNKQAKTMKTRDSSVHLQKHMDDTQYAGIW